MVKFSIQDNQIVSEPAGTFTQYPFRLAWAVTIHKSQGKTFDNVIIDLGRGAFASGQTYVALSRCTSLEGVTLRSALRYQDIQTDPRIVRFLTHHAYKQAADKLPMDTRLTHLQTAIDERQTLHMHYLKANNTYVRAIIKPIRISNEPHKGKTFPCLWAFCPETDSHQQFNIRRIVQLTLTKQTKPLLD